MEPTGSRLARPVVNFVTCEVLRRAVSDSSRISLLPLLFELQRTSRSSRPSLPAIRIGSVCIGPPSAVVGDDQVSLPDRKRRDPDGRPALQLSELVKLDLNFMRHRPTQLRKVLFYIGQLLLGYSESALGIDDICRLRQRNTIEATHRSLDAT
jgi:hypothetical protein